jgi:4-hydroxy-4-methyl-2-oxoglutarate aldolase
VINILTKDQFDALRRLDTCTVSNAIETFDVRLRNEGFTDSTVRPVVAGVAPMLGYAATARFRSSSPPPVGHSYFDRTDWWNYLLTIPEPRVVVLEDVDARPGAGAILGEVHSNILIALGCVGAVTNGAVRDVLAVEAAGFHLFAGCVSVSHAYAHIIDFGVPVRVGGLAIEPGDLVHGDRHGVQTIPGAIASRIPEAARRAIELERRVIELCKSKEFSLSRLREAVAGLDGKV